MANSWTPSKRPGEKGVLILNVSDTGFALDNNLDGFLYYGVGTCKLSVRGAGWTGAIAVKKRGMGSTQTAVDTIYQDASSDTTVGAGTDITADGEYYVRCDADQIVLDYTHTGGSVTIEYWHRLG